MSALAAAATLAGCSRRGPELVEVNNRFNGLTPTEVRRVLRPRISEELVRTLRRALHHNAGLSLAGGRYASGRQPFGTGTIHFDLSAACWVGVLDAERGLLRVGPGCTWDQVAAELVRQQPGVTRPWSLRQRPVGAEHATVGGCVASNIHGCVLNQPPLAADVEGLDLFTAEGEEIHCTRTQHADWFRLAVGGFGCFGVVTGVTLRLIRRGPLRVARRFVPMEYLAVVGREAAKAGIVASAGVLATEERAFFEAGDVIEFLPDESSGAMLCPDLALGHELRALESPLAMAEVLVPPECLEAFLARFRSAQTRKDFLPSRGVVRWTGQDSDSFLGWARKPWASVALTWLGKGRWERVEAVGRAVRTAIDWALELGGSFSLGYGNEADAAQVRAAYPNLRDFLVEKERRDRHGVWRSDWWKGYMRAMG